MKVPLKSLGWYRMPLPLSELFRPRIKPRRGSWVHFNTVVSEYGYPSRMLRDFLEINGIVVSEQEDWRFTRIYFHEEWLSLLKSGQHLSGYCLLQSQVRDDELTKVNLERWVESYKVSPRTAPKKMIRLLERLSDSKYIDETERKLLKDVMQHGFIQKERARLLIDYLIGFSTPLPNGKTMRTKDGIINERKRRHEMAKQAVGPAA
jgi:hypothetical protein